MFNIYQLYSVLRMLYFYELLKTYTSFCIPGFHRNNNSCARNLHSAVILQTTEVSCRKRFCPIKMEVFTKQ